MHVKQQHPFFPTLVADHFVYIDSLLIPPSNKFISLAFVSSHTNSQCLLSLQHLHVLLFVATLDYDDITRLNPTMTQRSSFTRHPMYPLSSLPNSSHYPPLVYVFPMTRYICTITQSHSPTDLIRVDTSCNVLLGESSR